MKDKNKVIKGIKQNINILNSLVLLIFSILFLLNIRFLYEILNYLPPVSIVTIVTISATLVLMTLYLSRIISKRVINELEEYENKLDREINERIKVEKLIEHQNGYLQRTLLEIAELRDLDKEHLTDLNVANEQLRLSLDATESDINTRNDFFTRTIREIRIPLDEIIDCSNITLNTELIPQQRDYIFKVKETANKLLEMLNSILDILKIDSGRLMIEEKDFNIQVIMDSIITKLSVHAQKKGLDLQLNINHDVPVSLSGDYFRLEQVLAHLISNAIEYTEHGKIAINIERVISSGDKIDQDSRSVLLHFSISDTGIGIVEEKMKSIFESFTQTEGSILKNHGTTRLGLNLSNKLVHMMGGEIWAESEYGKGSTFHFTSTFDAASQLQNQISPVPHIKDNRESPDTPLSN